MEKITNIEDLYPILGFVNSRYFTSTVTYNNWISIYNNKIDENNKQNLQEINKQHKINLLKCQNILSSRKTFIGLIIEKTNNNDYINLNIETILYKACKLIKKFIEVYISDIYLNELLNDAYLLKDTDLMTTNDGRVYAFRFPEDDNILNLLYNIFDDNKEWFVKDKQICRQIVF